MAGRAGFGEGLDLRIVLHDEPESAIKMTLVAVKSITVKSIKAGSSMARVTGESAGGVTLRRAALIACSALAICALAMPVAASRADTLNGALANAYQHNPQLNSQRAVVRQTDESVPQALSGYKPTVSATASAGEATTDTTVKTYNPFNPAQTVVLNEHYTYTPSGVGVTASQTLYNGNQTANRVRQAESNTSAARETLRVAEQTVLLTAATAYMDLLRDSALLDLQRRNVEVLQEQLRRTRALFAQGEATITDTSEVQAQLAQGRATVLSAEAQYARSRAAYRQAIGVEAGDLRPGAPVDRLTPRRLGEAIEIARARHPSVGVAQFGIDAAVLQVKINEGSLYPQARLLGSAQQSFDPSPPNVALRQFNAFVEAQITIPIYNAGPTGASDTFSAIRQSKELVGQRRIDLDTARDQVQASVVTAWGQLEAAKAQIAATDSQVAASEIALDAVRAQAAAGQRTTYDILLQQQNLVNARVAKVTAEHDRVVASYTLLAAVGELNLPKLGINIPLYDPMIHYQQVRDAWVGVRTPDGR
jgi:outer membrane protein